MSDLQNFTNHFLIAMPTLADPNFSQTVTYVCEHNEDGAMGIVINRPSDLTLKQLFKHLELESEDPELGRKPVYVGGPVQRERGFVLHAQGEWESTLEVGPGIHITTSKDILADIAQHGGPAKFLIALGYAGWGAGQLEAEMADNAWLSGPATAAVIFDKKNDERWHAAAAQLGVDISLLSGDAGHA